MSDGGEHEECIHDESEFRHDVIVFENEECRVSDEHVVKALENMQAPIERELESQNRRLEEDEEKLEKRSLLVFDPRSRVLRARNVAGVILQKNTRLWIIPKVLAKRGFPPDELRKKALALLYHMTSYVKEYVKIATTTLRREDPIDFLAGIYIELLSSELKRGVYREYIHVRGETRFIRGRILVREQLRRYPVSLHKPVAEYWQLSVDVPLNRVLYAATEKALQYGMPARARALEIINLLEDAEEIEQWIPRDVRTARFNRLNERFREPFNIACLILGFTGTLGREALVFIYNTHVLFEKYIYWVLLKAFPKLTVKYQENIGEQLFVNGEPANIKPDIVLVSKDETPLDVKYKEIGDEVPWPHIYQVAFYARVLNSSRAVLVYPSMDDVAKPIHVELRDAKAPLDLYLLKYNLAKAIESNEPDDGFIKEISQIIIG